eukprot:CAMPEP_0185559328 /NCGR_PEP_ID=MMETSP1381-20130426/54332_1 /TAXON_ID=298111 /ORGANISM="Pavlova sp., Strain CCMP459" /LENGTH=53 /DNA_ID=CAMNT_0028172939 /DNA_START=134 /DNA_END=295 /DNA_ORIENTATION=+
MERGGAMVPVHVVAAASFLASALIATVVAIAGCTLVAIRLAAAVASSNMAATP